MPFKKNILLFPSFPRAALLAVALLLLTAGAAFAADSADAAILNNQGVEFYQRGNYAAAAEKFKAAVLIDPKNVDLYINLGYAQQALGDHKAAVDAFKKGLSIDPTNLEAHNSLGVSLYNIGESERAVSEWEFVLMMDPGNATAAANLGIVHHPERADQIIADTKKALGARGDTGSAPQSLREMFAAGKQAFKEGDYEEAINLLTGVLEVRPTSKFSYYYLGLSQAYLGRAKDAMRNLREYLILENYPPESPESYTNAMNIFNALRAGKTLKQRPNRADLRAEKSYDSGRDAFKSGDFFKAIHLLRAACELKPDSYPVNYYLGLAYRAVGDKERATFHLTKCLMDDLAHGRKEEANEIARILKELTS